LLLLPVGLQKVGKLLSAICQTKEEQAGQETKIG